MEGSSELALIQHRFLMWRILTEVCQQSDESFMQCLTQTIGTEFIEELKPQNILKENNN